MLAGNFFISFFNEVGEIIGKSKFFFSGRGDSGVALHPSAEANRGDIRNCLHNLKRGRFFP